MTNHETPSAAEIAAKVRRRLEEWHKADWEEKSYTAYARPGIMIDDLRNLLAAVEAQAARIGALESENAAMALELKELNWQIDLARKAVEHELSRAEGMHEPDYPKAYSDGRGRSAIEILGEFNSIFNRPEGE